MSRERIKTRRGIKGIGVTVNDKGLAPQVRGSWGGDELFSQMCVVVSEKVAHMDKYLKLF